MKTLAMVMPIKAMATKALEFTAYTKGRWDIPSGADVPDDLRDTSPVLPYTADQKVVAGLLLEEDEEDRSVYNPAVLIAASLMPLSTVVMAMAALAPESVAKAALTTAGMISLAIAALATWLMARNAMPAGTILKTVFLGFLVPYAGLGVTTGAALSGALPDLSMATRGLANPGAVIALLTGKLAVIPIALFALWVVSFFTPYAKKPATTIYYIILAVLAMSLVFSLAPKFAFALTVIFAAYAPRSIFKAWEGQRAEWLSARGQAFGGQTGGKNLEAHITVRQQQAANAARNDAAHGKIFCGEATGELNKRLDPNAPDAGGKLYMGKDDYATHKIVVAETGGGKTDSVIVPDAVQWAMQKMGGMIIFDGKGDLAKRFVSIPGYILLTPPKYDLQSGLQTEKGVMISLVENCLPGLVTETLAAVLGNANKSQAQKDGDDYFRNQAMNLGKQAETLCYWLARTERHIIETGLDPKRQRHWLWSAYDIRRAIKLLANTDGVMEGDTRERPVAQWIEFLLEYCPVPVDRNPMLAECIEFINTDVMAMAKRDKEWGGIVSSATLYYDRLMQNRDILEWAKCEKGEVNPNGCLHNQLMGVYLPLHYGDSGILAQSLIRLQQVTEGRARGENWKKDDPTASDCLFVLDEAQRILTPKDEEVLSLGRSQGIYMLCATQSVNAFIERFGENGTKVMGTNFLSWVLMRCNKDSFEFFADKLPTTYRSLWGQSSAGKPDGNLTHTLSLNNPVNDWAFPWGGKRMERLAAHGAGKAVMYVPGTASGRIFTDYNEIMDNAVHNHKFTMIATKGQYEELPLVTKADFSALSKGQGYALVSVRRGGVDRRDFVRLEPMKEINPEWFQDH